MSQLEKYTTFERISRRLIGRLDVTEAQSAPPPWGNKIGGMVVDPELVRQVWRQKVAYLDSVLGMVYIVPLQLVSEVTQEILAEITENFIVSELLAIAYKQVPMPQTGSDPSGLAQNNRAHAEALLKMYVTGHNLDLPGSVSYPTQPNMNAPQPVVLPGERLRLKTPDTITRNETALGATQTYDKDIFGFQSFPNNRDRAIGSQSPY